MEGTVQVNELILYTFEDSHLEAYEENLKLCFEGDDSGVKVTLLKGETAKPIDLPGNPLVKLIIDPPLDSNTLKVVESEPVAKVPHVNPRKTKKCAPLSKKFESSRPNIFKKGGKFQHVACTSQVPVLKSGPMHLSQLWDSAFPKVIVEKIPSHEDSNSDVDISDFSLDTKIGLNSIFASPNKVSNGVSKKKVTEFKSKISGEFKPPVNLSENLNFDLGASSSTNAMNVTPQRSLFTSVQLANSVSKNKPIEHKLKIAETCVGNKAMTAVISEESNVEIGSSLLVQVTDIDSGCNSLAQIIADSIIHQVKEERDQTFTIPKVLTENVPTGIAAQKPTPKKRIKKIKLTKVIPVCETSIPVCVYTTPEKLEGDGDRVSEQGDNSRPKKKVKKSRSVRTPQVKTSSKSLVDTLSPEVLVTRPVLQSILANCPKPPSTELFSPIPIKSDDTDWSVQKGATPRPAIIPEQPTVDITWKGSKEIPRHQSLRIALQSFRNLDLTGNEDPK